MLVGWGMIRSSGTVTFLGLALQLELLSTLDVGSRRLLCPYVSTAAALRRACAETSRIKPSWPE